MANPSNPNGVPYRHDRPLTLKQQAYVDQRLSTPFITKKQAAINAGYAEDSASQYANDMEKDYRIRKALDKGRKKLENRLDLSKERILKELMVIAFADLKQVLTTDEDGNIVVTPEQPVEVAIETSTKHGIVKKVKTIRGADKTAALIAIGKHLGMFKDQLEVTGNLSIIDLVNQSMQIKAETEVIEDKDSA